MGGYKTTLAYLDPSLIDGGLGDKDLSHSRDARRIAEFTSFASEGDQHEIVDLKGEIIDFDEAVAARARKADAVLDRVLSEQKIRTDDPDFARRAAERNKLVEMQRALTTAAVGSDCDDDGGALMEPDELAPAYDTPKAASGFKVEKARPRRIKL